MLTTGSAAFASLLVIMYVLWLIGKVLEQHLPQKAPTWQSGAGAPPPPPEAIEAARLYREQNPNPFY